MKNTFIQRHLRHAIDTIFDIFFDTDAKTMLTRST